MFSPPTSHTPKDTAGLKCPPLQGREEHQRGVPSQGGVPSWGLKCCTLHGLEPQMLFRSFPGGVMHCRRAKSSHVLSLQLLLRSSSIFMLDTQSLPRGWQGQELPRCSLRDGVWDWVSGYPQGIPGGARRRGLSWRRRVLQAAECTKALPESLVCVWGVTPLPPPPARTSPVAAAQPGHQRRLEQLLWGQRQREESNSPLHPCDSHPCCSGWGGGGALMELVPSLAGHKSPGQLGRG